jgi:hypothetical protein
MRKSLVIFAAALSFSTSASAFDNKFYVGINGGYSMYFDKAKFDIYYGNIGDPLGEPLKKLYS